MNFSICYDATTATVVTRVQGFVTLKDIRERLPEVVRFGVESGAVRHVFDFRETASRLTTADVVSLPRIFLDVAAAHGIDPHNVRSAVPSPEEDEDFSPCETVWVSGGGRSVGTHGELDEANWCLQER